jgi:hypothetical protein
MDTDGPLAAGPLDRLGKIKVIYTKTAEVAAQVDQVDPAAPERMDSAVLGMHMHKLVRWD